MKGRKEEGRRGGISLGPLGKVIRIVLMIAICFDYSSRNRNGMRRRRLIPKVFVRRARERLGLRIPRKPM